MVELMAGGQTATWSLRSNYFVSWIGELEQVTEASLETSIFSC